MLKAIVFAAALATAGAGARVVYAQSSGGTIGGSGAMGGSSGTMGRGATGSQGTGSQTLGQGATVASGATAQFMTMLPQHQTAVSNWYDQNVYDQQDNKLGEIKDMLLDREGRVQAVIVSVGGFLGMGEKDVAVPFEAVNAAQRENRWWLTMNVNKDRLRSAPGFRFDRNRQAWTVASRD